MNRLGRNDPCHCGSGRKYKKCCLGRGQTVRPRGAATELEEPFVAELKPELDEQVDRLLQRLEQGAGRKIEPEITELWERHPHYHLTNYAMGVYKAHVLKDPAGAIPFFENAVRILPLLAEAHFNLGLAARQVCDVPKAVAAYRAAARCSAEDGIAELARKELQALETILLRNSSFPTLDGYLANAVTFDQAFERLATGHYKQAVELFKRVLAQNPGHVQSYGNLGLAYAALGQRSAALECFDRALKLDPHYEPALLNRRCVAQMRDGEPFVPKEFREVNFYREKLQHGPGQNDTRAGSI
jgi:tetratricopeptide (TPR) repeat protein